MVSSDHHSTVGMVNPEDPGLGSFLTADDALHNKLKKQRLGAFPVLEARPDPDILNVHRNAGAR